MSMYLNLLAVCFFFAAPSPESVSGLTTIPPSGSIVDQLMASDDAEAQALVAELAVAVPSLEDRKVEAFLRTREVLFDYFFDAGYTMYAGYKIILCSGQILQGGVVTSHVVLSYDPCGTTNP